MQAKNILFTLNRNGGSGFIKKKWFLRDTCIEQQVQVTLISSKRSLNLSNHAPVENNF